jgi:hypothetical protein
MSEVYETDKKGKVVKNRQGKIKTKSEIRLDGRANSEWLKKNKLTEASKPSEWFEALIPLKQNHADPVSLVTINDWATYMNKKAMLAHASLPGGVYYDWKPFSPQEAAFGTVHFSRSQPFTTDQDEICTASRRSY